MSNVRHSKRQVAAARQQRQTDETEMLRVLVAALPFHKIIQMWEVQQRKVRSERQRNCKPKG